MTESSMRFSTETLDVFTTYLHASARVSLYSNNNQPVSILLDNNEDDEDLDQGIPRRAFIEVEFDYLPRWLDWLTGVASNPSELPVLGSSQWEEGTPSPREEAYACQVFIGETECLHLWNEPISSLDDPGLLIPLDEVPRFSRWVMETARNANAPATCPCCKLESWCETGTIVGKDSDGCQVPVSTYRCPHCGEEWSEA